MYRKSLYIKDVYIRLLNIVAIQKHKLQELDLTLHKQFLITNVNNTYHFKGITQVISSNKCITTKLSYCYNYASQGSLLLANSNNTNTSSLLANSNNTNTSSLLANRI